MSIKIDRPDMNGWSAPWAVEIYGGCVEAMQLITGRVTDFNYHTRVRSGRVGDGAQLLPAAGRWVRLGWLTYLSAYT